MQAKKIPGARMLQYSVRGLKKATCCLTYTS